MIFLDGQISLLWMMRYALNCVYPLVL